MDGVISDLSRVSGVIETVLWSVTWLGILAGWLRCGGAGLIARWTAWRRSSHTQGADSLRVVAQVVSLLLAATLAGPSPAGAQGWWWGGSSNPGFDQNTVIQVTGRVTLVDLVPRGAPSTLHLETGQETFTVMLGPGWYLTQVQCDFRVGDPITVEGSKMMDPRGNLHVVAARITNLRTGSVLELRDDMGRPRWMGGRPQGKGR